MRTTLILLSTITALSLSLPGDSTARGLNARHADGPLSPEAIRACLGGRFRIGEDGSYATFTPRGGYFRPGYNIRLVYASGENKFSHLTIGSGRLVFTNPQTGVSIEMHVTRFANKVTLDNPAVAYTAALNC